MFAQIRLLLIGVWGLLSLTACTQTQEAASQPNNQTPTTNKTPTLKTPTLTSHPNKPEPAAMRAYRDPGTGEFITAPEQAQDEPTAKTANKTPTTEDAPSDQSARSLDTHGANITQDTERQSTDWLESPQPGGGIYMDIPEHFNAPLKAEKRDGKVEIRH